MADLQPTLVVTLHTPVGDVPIAADPSGGGGGGSVTILGVTMPYDVSLQLGAPLQNAPGTVLGNLSAISPVAAVTLMVAGAFLFSRRR